MRTIVILSLLLLTAGIAVAQKISDPFEGISTQLKNHCDSLLDRGIALFVIELGLPNDEEFDINSELRLCLLYHQ